MVYKKFLDLPILRVYEDARVWHYIRSYTKSGLPYYTAPEEKNRLHKNVAMDDIIFLPIDYKTFISDRTNYYYGFRYIIATPGSTTIEFAEGIDFPASTTLQIGFEVSRIRYFMDDDMSFDIAVDFMGDAMFPTLVVTVNALAENLQPIATDVVQNLLDQHCNWYSDKKI